MAGETFTAAMVKLKMMVNLTELKNYLVINARDLDNELIRQSSLFFSISESYVEAVSIRDTKKEELASVDAELDALARLTNDKPTENRIKGMIQLNPKHQEAFVAYNEAKLMADRLGAMKEAFHQRGSMLKELAQLAISNLYEVASSSQSPNAVSYELSKQRLANKRKQLIE